MMSMTETDVQANIDQAKNILLHSLTKEGVITDEQLKEASKYVILIHRKGWFNRVLDKMIGVEKDEETIYFTAAKIISLNGEPKPKAK